LVYALEKRLLLLMIDLTDEMADLLAALGPPKVRPGRVYMFVSAYEGEGTSSFAREFALCDAALAPKPVWLVDADLGNQTQLKSMLEQPKRFGPPGPVTRASPDQNVFFSITPKARSAKGVIMDHSYLVARPFLTNRLWVTRFRTKYLLADQKVRAVADGTYWHRLRRYSQTVVIDVACVQRSAMAFALAPHIDGIIMVVSEDRGDVETRQRLKEELEQAGGRVLGLVYNRVSANGVSRRRGTRRTLLKS
jgi:Mrp family chromosome partitioning ATPase